MFDSEKPRPGMPPAGASSLTRLCLGCMLFELSGKRTRLTYSSNERSLGLPAGASSLRRTAWLAWVVEEVADP
jgi:hypothetical protein